MRNQSSDAEVELLVQRFIDQALTADERVRFVVRLGRDEALRRRVLALEQVVRAAGRLAPPVVPAGFVAEVMRRTQQPDPVWRRWAAQLLKPRPLQWSPAGAAAICVALLFAGALLGRFGGADPVPGRGASPSEPLPRVLVRLVVLQPDARAVQVAGDFNGWDPARTPLEPLGTGAWTVTLPLEPGRYKYMFVVDGATWIPDPFASEQEDDGFGARNAVLDVRAGEEPS